MAYEKQEWKNDSAPYIDAANLNRMEDGIDGALPKSGGTITGMNYSQVSRHKKVQFFLGEQAILSAPNIKLPLHLA